MIQYSQKGCPMCDMLKAKQAEANIQYETETDVDTLIARGIIHVPVQELDNGQRLKATEAIQWINGGNTCR